MKKTKLFITCSFCLLTIALIAQWEWQNSLPQGNRISALSFIDENNGWAVGWNTILHTSDGGSSWQIQEIGTVNGYYDQMLKDVCFTDALHGWIVGGMPGFILHTVDGGNYWTMLESGITKLPSSKTDVFFLDNETGWVLGWAAYSDSVFIQRTTDGGNTWDWINITDLTASSAVYDGSFYFIDNTEGWVVYNKKIMHSTDGGINWEIQYDEGSGMFRDVFFIDSEHGWAVGEAGEVLITSNGGTSWESSTDTSLNGIILRAVSFTNVNTGWVGGYYDNDTQNGGILTTTDGGFTWENQLPGAEIKPVYCLTFENESGGFAAGENGEMLKAVNCGDDWDMISSSVTTCDFRDVFFTDTANGWAIGGTDSSDVYIPSVFHTSDGGINWNEQEVPFTENHYLYNIFFTDPQHGWALGRDNYYGGGIQLISTTNGGENWELQSTEEIGGDIYFNSPSLGWRVGDNGTIQKTIDGGWNWADQISGTNANLSSLCFVNDEIGWVAGVSIILNTSDGGETWIVQSSGIFPWSDIFFINEFHGWVVGSYWDYGKTMRTLDGGQTWEEINEFGFHEIVFFDSENGWGRSSPYPGGTGGSSPPVTNIFKTNDGGLTWKPQQLPTLIHGGFYFTDANHGWAVGNNGTILHTNNGGVTGFEEIQIQSSVFDIKSYPNPFTTATNISYELQHSSSVQLTIYNHLGEQLEVIRKTQSAGKQQVAWNAEGLPAGVYYFRLQAGKQVASGKMILMR